MKHTLTILLTLFAIVTYAQANNDTIQVIAKLISAGEGRKIRVAEYEVIKVIKGTLSSKTIKVGYYTSNAFRNAPETALLNLFTSKGDIQASDYYTFPDFDAKKGIEKVSIAFVDFAYWEGCETGEGECKPLTFSRSSKDENWFLFMLCGETIMNITFTASGQKSPIKEVSLSLPFDSRVFDLTKVPDGKYYAYVFASGLGGQIEINLKTNKE